MLKTDVPFIRLTLVLVCGGVGLTLSPALSAQTFLNQGTAVLGGVNYESRSASLGDMDGDGDLDLLFQGASGAQQLFKNNLVETGTLTYSNVTATMLPVGIGSSWSAAWADYNGDGNTDVFVGKTNFGTSGTVLRNDGAAGFSDQSSSIGLDDPGFHQNVAWNDIDGDRDLDLIIAMEGPEEHEIYLQQDDGTFDPVGAAAGFQVDFGTKAYGMAIGDTDGDGDLDIYLSTCQPGGNIRNNFFENQLAQTGTLSFIDIADSNGTQFMDNSYGAEFHDFDDDGDLDLFMVGADSEPSKLWRNDGGNQFTDTDTLRGGALLTDTAGDLNGGKAIDYDNDGDLDLFFHDHLASNGANGARKLYRNDGNWNFTDATPVEGFARTNRGAYDSVWGDLDRDGDQDLIAPTDGRFDEEVFISNASTNGNHWFYAELEGTPDNTTGLGATLYATINKDTQDERTLRREANTNAGTFNQSDLPVHFGLGDADVIDLLKIVWPDGNEQVLFDVAADQYLSVAYAAQLDGDYTGDGAVDQGDLDLVLLHWGEDAGATGVPNGWLLDTPSGTIGQAHLDDVLLNWGSTNESKAGRVPEPASLAWLGTGLALIGRWSRGGTPALQAC